LPNCRIQSGDSVTEIRLQKLLSQSGVASRRAAEQLMREGRVSVNGQTVTELGTKADAERDDIRVDGRRVRTAEPKRYLLLNKPRGYVSTRSDPQRRPTVIDLLKGVREYVYPVGRLDYDSEGLLLLTNDGDLAARLTHPRYGVERAYEARVRGVPDRRGMERLSKGIVIDGRRTAPAKARLRRAIDAASGPQAVVELTLREGRKRQARLMFEAIGHPVVRLRRVRIGPISDDRLKTGHWRELTRQEIQRLKKMAGL
jgi:pseudouridine synthase